MMTAGTAPTRRRPDPRTHVDVVDLGRSDWRLLRRMRLLAINEAPHAFVRTWRQEWVLRDKDWLDRFTGRRWVAARAGSDVVAIACLAPPNPRLDPPHGHFMESVWVEPLHRRQGVLRRVVDQVEAHARREGATELRLWVLDTNESAADAYLKLGFSPALDSDQPTSKRTDTSAVVMERLYCRPILG